MINLPQKVDTSGLEDVIFALGAVGAGKLPATAASVSAAIDTIQERWVKNAMGAFTRSSGGYVRGIMEGAVYPYENDMLKGAVINNSPQAIWVEDGTPPHDMKKMLHTSAKVRISSKGKRYLIIPFRHATPRTGAGQAGTGINRATMKSMPPAVYKMAKTLAPSYRTKSTRVVNPVTNRTITRQSYSFGGRLTQNDLNAMGLGEISRRPHWKSSPYAGLVRFPRDDRSTQYMTFRVMSEDSTGWMHPGTKPNPLAQKTADQVAPVVAVLIADGFEADLKGLLSA